MRGHRGERHLPGSQNQDPMHVIWHHDEFAEFHRREAQGLLSPRRPNHVACAVAPHPAVANLAEQQHLSLCTNREEV